MKDLVGVARDVRVCSGAGGAAVTVGVGAIWTALGAGSSGDGGADVVVVMVAADGGSPAMLNTCADVDVRRRLVDGRADLPHRRGRRCNYLRHGCDAEQRKRCAKRCTQQTSVCRRHVCRSALFD